MEFMDEDCRTNSSRLTKSPPSLVKSQYSIISSMTVFSEEFDTLVERKMREYHVPGISCAVIKGEEVFSKVC